MKLFPELIQAYELLVKERPYPDRDYKYYAKLILFTHDRGYLYFGKEEGKVKAVAIAYRVKDLENNKEIPEEDDGDILFVPMLVSKARNKRIPLKMLRVALKMNPGIKEVKYMRRVKNVSKTTV